MTGEDSVAIIPQSARHDPICFAPSPAVGCQDKLMLKAPYCRAGLNIDTLSIKRYEYMEKAVATFIVKGGDDV